MKLERARLGVNIDHIATIRNARGGVHPDPAKAAAIAQAAGADGITIHLREDRRHIRDADLEAVRGLDVARLHNQVEPFVRALREGGSRVSLFIEPSKVQIAVAEAMGAPVVELHTGKYVELVFAGDHAAADEELNRLREAAAYGHDKGIEIHVGHGLTYDTVRPVAAIPEVRELNIGHFIMGEALFVGLDAAVRRMRQEIDLARGHI